MQIYDSIIEGLAYYPDRARKDALDAIVSYVYWGREPDQASMQPLAYGFFLAQRPSLEKARSGRKGGRAKPKASNQARHEAIGQANAEANAQADREASGKAGARANSDAGPNEQVSSSFSSSSSCSCSSGPCPSESERTDEKGSLPGEPPKPRAKAKPFRPPTAQEVAAYAQSRGYAGFRASAFCDYYASVGWKVGGKAPMRDWKAAVRNWWARDHPGASGQVSAPVVDPYAEAMLRGGGGR